MSQIIHLSAFTILTVSIIRITFGLEKFCLLPKGYCLQSNYMTEEEWLSLFGSKTKSFLFWDWDSTDAVEQDSRIPMDAVSSLLLF